MHQLLGHLYPKPPWKSVRRVSSKKCREIIETKLGYAQCGFCAGRITLQTKSSLSSKILRNLGSMPKTTTDVLSTLRKHMISPREKFCGVLREHGVNCHLLMVVSNCIPVQAFVSLSAAGTD